MGQIMTWAAEIARGKCDNLVSYHTLLIHKLKKTFCSVKSLRPAHMVDDDVFQTVFYRPNNQSIDRQ